MQSFLTSIQYQVLVPYLTNLAINILVAGVTFFVGLWVIKYLCHLLRVILEKQKLEKGMVGFLMSLVSVTLKILLGVSILSILGVATTSFLALIGAAGFTLGASLSGTLQNFAAGVMILLFKPYKIGDRITTNESMGTVSDIQIFNTILKTPSKDTVVIPNSKIVSNKVVNHSTEKLRRVDLEFGIAYNSNISNAKKVIRAVLDNHKLILKNQNPIIEVKELSDSSIIMAVYPWVKQSDYIQTTLTLPEQIKIALDEAQITIPFPTMKVHLAK